MAVAVQEVTERKQRPTAVPAPTTGVKTASLAQLEVLGAETAYGERITAADAAAKILKSVWPDPDAVRHLVHVGLTREIQAVLDTDRVIAVDPERAKRAARTASRPARTLTGDVLADLVLVAADGSPKALLRFDLTDWERLASVASGEIEGATRRHATAQLATDLLNAEGKTETAALSADAQKQLRSAVAEAWR